MSFEITFTTFTEGGEEIILKRGEYPVMPNKGDTVILYGQTFMVNIRKLIYEESNKFRAQINITKCDFLMGEVV